MGQNSIALHPRAIGLNHSFVGKIIVAGKGTQKRTTCCYHQGSANYFLSSVHLLPETESGVVILINSMAQNDAADWLGELYLEAILGNPDSHDYVKLAEVSAEAALACGQECAGSLPEIKSRIHQCDRLKIVQDSFTTELAIITLRSF